MVPFGIPPQRFELDENQRERVDTLRDGIPSVLFVGRLVHYKGVEFLIRALENIKARLWIVGTGPLKSRCETWHVRRAWLIASNFWDKYLIVI